MSWSSMPPRRPGRRAAGFTLVELIVVIVVLGILAASAFAAMVDLGSDARAAKLKEAMDAVRSAANLQSGAQQARGLAHNASVNGVTMLNRYPTANAAGILAATEIDSTAFQNSPGTIAHPPNSIVIRVAAARVPASCSFFYSSPLSLGQGPVVSGLSTSGC
jgi:MSHA pilin protein MshA